MRVEDKIINTKVTNTVMDSSAFVSLKIYCIVFNDFEYLLSLKIRSSLNKRRIRTILKSKGKIKGR